MTAEKVRYFRNSQEDHRKCGILSVGTGIGKLDCRFMNY
jgi:hypothetical protein